jgi:hypothetical protein
MLLLCKQLQHLLADLLLPAFGMLSTAWCASRLLLCWLLQLLL